MGEIRLDRVKAVSLISPHARSYRHFMLNKKVETIRIAMEEFGHPRDVAEGAASVSIKAIDPKNPGGAGDESLRKNIEVTIALPLKLKESPPLTRLVDFSLVQEVQRELSVGSRR